MKKTEKTVKVDLPAVCCLRQLLLAARRGRDSRDPAILPLRPSEPCDAGASVSLEVRSRPGPIPI